MKRLLIKPSTTFYGQSLKKNIWTKQQKLEPLVNRNGTLLGYVQIRGENPYISPLTAPDAPANLSGKVVDDIFYSYYRLNIISDNGANSFVGTAELGLYEEVGGSSIAVGAGGTAFASEFFSSFPPEQAFDGVVLSDGSTGWASASDTPSYPVTLGYQFTEQKRILEYGVGAYPTSTDINTRSVGEFYLQGSNNGTDWTDLDHQITTSWVADELKRFELTF